MTDSLVLLPPHQPSTSISSQNTVMSTSKIEEREVGSPTASDTIQLHLTTLTPELKYAIFTNLPDVTSAKSLALVSSSFYYTFLDAQSLILTEILQNEISTDLLQGAFAAYKASKIPLWTKQAIRTLLDEYFGRTLLHTNQNWNLSEALHMSNIHNCVEFFAAEFASSALSKNPTTRGSNAAPSAAEMARIKRTLYRFELYCNLFRQPSFDRMRRDARNCLIRPGPFGTQEQQDFFFDKFSPWENEQLGCIHDYLIEEITIPFRDVAKHDVDFGELSIPWVETFGRSELFYKEGYLLKGLDYIFQLTTARTYDDRHRILLSGQDCEGSFLSNAMSPPRLLPYQSVTLEEYFDEKEAALAEIPFDDDNESGAAEAWRWAHATTTRKRPYFLEDHRPLRQRGYVMWDLRRLLEWNLIEKPVGDLIARHRLSYPELLRWEAEQDEQMESWEERSRIWQEGGEGWWAPGDESQIRWPREHPKYRAPSTQKSPQKYALALPKDLQATQRSLG